MPTQVHGAGVDDSDVDSNIHSPMKSFHSPSSIPQNARISLVRNSSTGRPVWWIDHGISSMRAEVIMRRKMVYLQEVHYNGAASAAVDTIDPDIVAVEERSEDTMESDTLTKLESAAAELIQHPRLHPSIGNSHCETRTNEPTSISSKIEFLHSKNSNNINNMSESLSRTKPQSSNDGCDDANYLNETKMHDESLAHEISLDDHQSILAPTMSTSSNIDQTFPSPHRRHQQHLDNVPTVQLLSLSTTDNQRQRTYLDFGEYNIVGKMTHQYFCILAPHDEHNSGGGREFHVRLKQCLPERGIVCSNGHHTILDAQDSSCDDNNVISFRMKRGESTRMQVMWNPVVGGCVRERIDLEVNNDNGIHWKQSLVLVGEAHCAAMDDDIGRILGAEDAVVSHDRMMEKQMVSDITDTVFYPRGDITLENSVILNSEEELSLEDQCRYHHHHVLEETKVDSMVYSQETNEVLPKMDDSNVEDMPLWNVNLSEIKEFSDNDTREEVYPRRNASHQFAQKANEISVSLESGGSVLGQLAKIHETDTFTDISTIRSLEPSNGTVEGDITSMFHHFDVLTEEPHGCGSRGQTTAALARTQCAKDDWSQRHHISKLEKTKEVPIDISAEALEHQKDLDHQMVILEKEQLLTEEEAKQTRIKVYQDHQRLQSKQINDFEDLLVSEGLVEGEMTLAEDSSSDSQTELALNVNSSLIYFVESMRPKSPSFGSLSSKDSIDDDNSLPSTRFDEHPRRASLYSASLAKARDYLHNPMNGKAEDFDLLSQSELSVFRHSSHIDVEDEPSISFAQMMEQTSDSDNSCEEELGNAKSELNALIDEISEMEIDAQFQHEYITSPSNLDFYSQLVNLNDHADGTTPISVNRINGSKQFFQSEEPGSQPLSNNDKPSTKALSTVNARMVAKRISLAKESMECELDRRISNISTQPPLESEHGTPREQDAAIKTPHDSRLQTIASIRNKLCLIKIDDTLSNGSTPHIADRACHTPVSPAVTPRGILMVNDLPNSTKTSARKCYFYTSPARQRSPDERSGKASLENELLPKYTMAKGQNSDKEGKSTLSVSHLRPRAVKAQEKHIQSIREQKKVNSSPISSNARNGLSPLSTSAPSPRELKAYEKHIRSMRERLNRVGLMYSCPDALISSSPTTRHVPRIGGANSPMERGRWTG